MARMPAYYIPHGGGPCFFMDWTPPDAWTALGAWLGAFPSELPERPRALLVLSAHWEEAEFTLLSNPAPGLYYDYYGFPPHTYELLWPAPPAPGLFPRIRGLMAPAGLKLAEDDRRDFDHGVFVPGKLAFPRADIPTLQISLKRGLNPAAHFALGQALAPLRDEGVLFLGSGMSFHNMRAFRGMDNNPIPGGDDFDAWLKASLALEAEERKQRLLSWEDAPRARFAHPREEHLIPLLVIAGSAGTAPGRRVFHGRAMGAPLAAFAFD